MLHAAAHEHVPPIEANPEEALTNNVFGTRNMAQVADKYKMNQLVMIFSDRAMRFGNVLGESVVPLFRKQITEGGPVAVAHLDMARCFMTMPEACSL